MASRTPTNPLFVVALLVTWFAWGASFVAIAWTLDALPPFLLMSTRFLAAGSVALAIGVAAERRAGRSPGMGLREWRDATVVGLGFIVVAMGATSWAATRLPSGIAALLVATAPLWIVLLELVVSRGRSASVLALLGVAAGTVGVAVLVVPGGDGSVDALAAAVLVAANGIWAAATLFARRAARPRNLFVAVGMQMLTGGALLAVLAAAVGEGSRLELGALDARAAGSWLFLVVASSLGGFLAYGWLLDNASASVASTHAFINPLVAVALGATVLGESITTATFVAGGAIVVAVLLLLVAESRVPAATSVAASQPRERRAAARRAARLAAGVAARQPALGSGAGRGGRRLGWSPAPTPSFAARRPTRPGRPTDPMDPLAIDEALDSFGQ